MDSPAGNSSQNSRPKQVRSQAHKYTLTDKNPQPTKFLFMLSILQRKNKIVVVLNEWIFNDTPAQMFVTFEGLLYFLPLSYFSFQPVLHDWCNKGRGMCYPVCGMVHIKEPLLLIDKSSLCGGSGFPFSLSEWSLTICLMPYNLR